MALAEIEDTMSKAYGTTSSKKNKKKRWTVLRFRANQPEHNLIAAVSHFVRAHGGRCLTIGGIETLDYGDPYKFKVAVGCVGKKPVKARDGGD